jgi:hypothetical protein
VVLEGLEAALAHLPWLLRRSRAMVEPAAVVAYTEPVGFSVLYPIMFL